MSKTRFVAFATQKGENFNLSVYAIVAGINYKNRTFIYQLIYRES